MGRLLKYIGKMYDRGHRRVRLCHRIRRLFHHRPEADGQRDRQCSSTGSWARSAAPARASTLQKSHASSSCSSSVHGLSALFSYVQGFIMTGVSNKVTYRLRQDISRKINTLPLSYFDRNSHGDVLSRVTNDVDTISQTLNQSLSRISSPPSRWSLSAVAVDAMFTINWIISRPGSCRASSPSHWFSSFRS